MNIFLLAIPLYTHEHQICSLALTENLMKGIEETPCRGFNLFKTKQPLCLVSTAPERTQMRRVCEAIHDQARTQTA
jgi:hypothetical protein